MRSTEQSVGIKSGAFDPDIIFIIAIIHREHNRERRINSTKKAVPANRSTAFTNFLNLIVLCIRLVRLRRESATARSNKIKGRDRANCPVNRKKALPRELVTPLLSLVFYVLSFVEMILLRESAKVNTFCCRKMSVIFAIFSVLCTKPVYPAHPASSPESASRSHRCPRHCPAPPGRKPSLGWI